MSEEEKKALENLKKNRGINFKEADVLSNLIEKQQKEIEELNKNKQQIAYEEIYTPDYIEENFINKDEIRGKIKELEDYMILFTNDKEKFNKYRYARNILQELLEENK